MLLEELEPHGQPLQGQGHDEARALSMHSGRYAKWPSCGELRESRDELAPPCLSTVTGTVPLTD